MIPYEVLPEELLQQEAAELAESLNDRLHLSVNARISFLMDLNLSAGT